MVEISLLSDLPGQVVVLGVRGDVDLDSAEVLQSELIPLCADGVQLIVLDLSDVTFFDSTGLRSLLESQRSAAGRGVQVALTGVSASIAKLLTITGLNDSFPTYATPAQAVDALPDLR